MKNKFVTFIKFCTRLLVLAVFVAAYTGCQDKEDNPSLYNSGNFHNGARPIITSISILNAPLGTSAVLAKIRITGQNFSTNLADNLVVFGNLYGKVLASTATTIDVQAPYVDLFTLPDTTVNVSDSIYVMISGDNAALYPSNKVSYPLTRVLRIISNSANVEMVNARAVATDNSGNIYISLATPAVGGVKMGVTKLAANGVETPLLSANDQQYAWEDMKVGPNNDLYFCGPLRGVKILKNGTTALGTFSAFSAADGIESLNAMDFDANNYLWVGGKSSSRKLYSLSPTSPVVQNPTVFPGIIKTLRVYNGYLYIGAIMDADTTYRIVKYQILAGGALGASYTEVLNVSSKYPGKIVSSLTFAQDGDMYLSFNKDWTGLTDNPGIIVLHPNSSIEEFYPSALVSTKFKGTSAAYNSLYWGAGNYMYAVCVNTENTSAAPSKSRLIKINMFKNGATYYGKP
ncbi:MAG: IPT/TIG domain-containing protein [Ignavibacteria bacterium]|nr:IPT/TIG domain-containing protein [Ignavibacteria bacterium]